MAVLDWLLDSDPAIRWQVLRDLGRALVRQQPFQDVDGGRERRADFRSVEDGDGRPSRWNTLRALRVLGWCEPA